MNYDFPLFETIAIEQGRALNLPLHQQRYQQSLLRFYAKDFSHTQIKQSAVNLAEILKKPLQNYLVEHYSQVIRCRIDYNLTQQNITFYPYLSRSIRTFRPVHCDDIDYSLKFSDRTLLNELYSLREECDEIIIIKQGWVTDCSIGNLIFRDGDKWITPDTPLLAGTQRAALLQQGKIEAHPIHFEELGRFSEIRVINALNGL